MSLATLWHWAPHVFSIHVVSWSSFYEMRIKPPYINYLIYNAWIICNLNHRTTSAYTEEQIYDFYKDLQNALGSCQRGIYWFFSGIGMQKLEMMGEGNGKVWITRSEWTFRKIVVRYIWSDMVRRSLSLL